MLFLKLQHKGRKVGAMLTVLLKCKFQMTKTKTSSEILKAIKLRHAEGEGFRKELASILATGEREMVSKDAKQAVKKVEKWETSAKTEISQA